MGEQLLQMGPQARGHQRGGPAGVGIPEEQDGAGPLVQLLPPEGGHRLPVLLCQSLQGGLPVGPPLGLGQLQQEGDVLRVLPQGGEDGPAHVLLRLGQQLPQPGGGLRPLDGGDHLHPAGHGTVSGGIEALLHQRQGGGARLLQNFGVQLGQLDVAVPQAVYHRGQDPEVGEKFGVVLPGGLDDVHPASAGGGERLQQRVELAVGQLPVLAAPGGQGDQLPLYAGFSLGVGYRVHQGQQVQQEAGAGLRRGGQQLFQSAVNLSKHRAGPRQGF